MMTNPLHYPSLELCKKLTKIGFPKTEKIYCSTFKIWDDLIPISTWEFTIADEKYNVWYVCPSVMEMWDIIQTYIWKYNRADDFYKSELRISKYDVSYSQIEECESIISFPILHNNTLPDCLAEMVIWLKNNNHLPKK